MHLAAHEEGKEQRCTDSQHRKGTGNEVADVELLHGDYTRVTAGSFVWLNHNTGTNPEQSDSRGDQAKGTHNQREENPTDVACCTVKRHPQDHSTDVLSSSR